MERTYAPLLPVQCRQFSELVVEEYSYKLCTGFAALCTKVNKEPRFKKNRVHDDYLVVSLM